MNMNCYHDGCKHVARQAKHSEIFSRGAPFQVFSMILRFQSKDQQFWWNKTASIIAELMVRAKYDIGLQYQYLSLYYYFVLPTLGPRATSEGQPHWKSFCTDDFSPVEPSWNCQRSGSTIRFSFEPVGYLAGTKQDPFNQLAVKQLMRRIQRWEPGIDITWFKHFENEFFIREENYEAVCAKVPANEHTTQSFIAFDLTRGKLSMKAYFFPILKSLQTGLSTTAIVSAAILRIDEPDGLSLIPALSVLKEWIASVSSCRAPKVEMIAIDCNEPRHSRIKLYVRIPRTDLKSVIDTYTLGGRLRDSETQAGVASLKELWQLLFGIPNNGDPEDRELTPRNHRTAGIIFNFEIKPGKPFPSPQLYIPVRHYCKSDLDISKALSSFFERRGWPELTQSYSSDLESIFPTHPLSTKTGTHTYVSFSYRKDSGVYVTMYYSPRVYYAS